MKNKSTIVSIIIGIICVIIWFSFIDLSEMISYIKALNIYYLLIAAFLYLFSYLIRSYRWKVILSTEVNIKTFTSYAYWMAGNFINYIIPIRAGELAKCLFLKKNYDKPISVTLPSVFIDKMFDSIAIFFVLALLPFLNVNVSKSLLFLIIILTVIFVLSITILILSAIAKKKVVTILHKILFFIPKKFQEKIYSAIDTFVEGVGLFKNHMNLLPIVIILTFAAVIVDSIYFSFMFLAFGQRISFLTVLFGYTLIYLSYILPQPPAQLGSNELIMVIIFTIGLGLGENMVSAVMTVAHLITGFLIVLIGIISLSYSGFSFVDFSRKTKF